MIITNAILGLLNFENLSGYDIKKKIQESMYFPWTGNNNQVYKALSELLEKEYVTSENITQSNAPAKKVYNITEKGREQLKVYAKSEFEPLKLNKPFLLRILTAKDLNKAEFQELIDNYKAQLSVDLNKLVDKQPNEFEYEDVSAFILNSIYKNELTSINAELQWLEGLEKDLDTLVFTKIQSEEKTTISDKTSLTLKYEIFKDYILYSVANNGKNNFACEKYIKHITIDVIENNQTHFVIEKDIFSKESLTKDLIELMQFEFKKYNISFEIM